MTDFTPKVSEWLANFSAALDRLDFDGAVRLFADESYWRDLVSFTWNIKTAEGKEEIKAMLEATVPAAKPGPWRIEGDAALDNGVISSWFSFETTVARGKGHLRLIDGKCLTLLTTMVELKGFEERKGAVRPKGVQHGAYSNRQNWLERRNEEAATLGVSAQPYCLIIGGGQGGIALGARLKQLEVPTINNEKNDRPGDSWRRRYKSLCLHDPVWYDHMPYLPFPDHWPIFCPKDKLGDWLEMYTKVMELNFWHSTECQGAVYDEASREWVVTVNRAGETVVLRPKQLVLATGMSGVPNIPEVPGAKTFKGRQHHSSKHTSGEEFRGQTCIVVGAGNSAHDICADLWEHGADVTMIQRSSTNVVRSDILMEMGLGSLYSEAAVKGGITTDVADLIFASIPYKMLPTFHIPLYLEITKLDREFYDRLTKAGFLLDFGEDGSGLFVKYLRRGSGYYIDVGASQLIAEGKIKLKSGIGIQRLKEHSVVMTDGSELPADLIVYATGYGSMNGWAAKIISQEVANKVGKCWGLGSGTAKDPGPWEGELRNMWKPTQQTALWFHGGNLHQSRHYSQFLALQIKARKEGVPTPVYGLGEAHHLS
ncbi:MAG: putative flavoprotein involved in transport [Verrucomicrobiota bacterium]|nr:putative flavoprotein involved in transport [Verrucomicrobiota bacterium]